MQGLGTPTAWVQLKLALHTHRFTTTKWLLNNLGLNYTSQLEKNMSISGPEQFIATLFKGWLYIVVKS